MARTTTEIVESNDALLEAFNYFAPKVGLEQTTNKKEAMSKAREILIAMAAKAKERRIAARPAYFHFRPLGVIKEVKKSTLRGRCVALLTEGADFEAVKTLVREFDEERGTGNADTLERRAYELVRLMHFQLGYGLRQDQSTGTISIYTENQS